VQEKCLRRSALAAPLALTLTLLGPLLLATDDAQARPMDPTLAGLLVDPSCGSSAAVACAPDRALYTKLVSQLGFALAPHPVHGARTTGLAGFDVSALASLTSIESSGDYWRRGTLGSGDAPGLENADPDKYLQLYALELRKGFGFGIEAAASLGVMPHTSVLSWGADLRVALLEGMRHGAWRYLPDTSIGASVRQATGLGELALGTLALDGRLSHPLSSPAGFVVTPWVGFQWVRIAADSSLVDLTPSVGALEACGYAGNDVPGSVGSPEAEGAVPASGAPAGALDGSPLCRGDGTDLRSSVSFGEATIQRQRVLVGATYQREPLRAGAQVVTDLFRPDAVQSDAGVSRALRCDANGESCRPSPRQWTLVLELGVSF
jgi:hypothetical protein